MHLILSHSFSTIKKKEEEEEESKNIPISNEEREKYTYISIYTSNTSPFVTDNFLHKLTDQQYLIETR